MLISLEELRLNHNFKVELLLNLLKMKTKTLIFRFFTHLDVHVIRVPDSLVKKSVHINILLTKVNNINPSSPSSGRNLASIHVSNETWLFQSRLGPSLRD